MLRLSVRSIFVRNRQAVTKNLRLFRVSRSTETLLSSSIDTVVSYLTLRSYARPWSTYASLIIVELSLQATAFIRSRGTVSDTFNKLIASMGSAQFCMEALGKTKLSAAKRASTQLTSMLQELRVLQAQQIPTLPPIDDSFMRSHIDVDGDGDSDETTVEQWTEIFNDIFADSPIDTCDQYDIIRF